MKVTLPYTGLGTVTFYNVGTSDYTSGHLDCCFCRSHLEYESPDVRFEGTNPYIVCPVCHQTIWLDTIPTSAFSPAPTSSAVPTTPLPSSDNAENEKKELAPGATVWCIRRNEVGIAQNIVGRMYLAEVEGYVIASSFINDIESVESTLAYHADQTVLYDFADVISVLPSCDCYADKEVAQAALIMENEK